MNLDEKLILMAWARGLAGAGSRLAKRAWWVLEDQQRRSPGQRVGAWTNAAEAQAWLLNFHTMGLVGLLDAPRVGRQPVHADKVLEALDRLEALAADDRATHHQKRRVLETLSQQEREALWRAVRRTGATVMRNRGGLDLSVPAPAGLRDLLAIHLGKGVKILAFLPRSSGLSDQFKGRWMGVPNTRISAQGAQAPRHDLIHALSTEVRVQSGAAAHARSSMRLAKKEAVLEARVLNHVGEVALAHPGVISLDLLVDLDAGPQIMRILKRLRACSLWGNVSRRNPGLLASLSVRPYQTAWAAAAQNSLAVHLQHVDAALLGDFLDKLTLKRQGVFSWVKTLADEPMEPESDWLEEETEDEGSQE